MQSLLSFTQTNTGKVLTILTLMAAIIVIGSIIVAHSPANTLSY